MARATRAPRGARKQTTVRVDMSNISKAFEPNQEYAVRIVECTLEEGQKAPYFNVKLKGIEGGDYENSAMYHRASTSEASLWRLRPFLEAFGFEIPEGPLDLDASDFLNREAMCSTFLERYDGGSSVKPDEFWPLEEGEGGKSSGEEGLDLDELSDEEVMELAKAVGVKARRATQARKALAEEDEDDVAEAWAKLSKAEDKVFDYNSLSDEDVMRLAEALGVSARSAARARTALGKLDQVEVSEVWAELGGDDEDDDPVTEDAIQEMNEDQLEGVVEKYELDVDLSKHKTLRKMKNAVIDAMEEGGHFED